MNGFIDLIINRSIINFVFIDIYVLIHLPISTVLVSC